MIYDTMNTKLVEVEILPGQGCWYVEGQDNSRSIHNYRHVVLGISKSLQLILMIASTLGAEVSKLGELQVAVVLSKQLSEMSQADTLLTRGL